MLYNYSSYDDSPIETHNKQRFLNEQDWIIKTHNIILECEGENMGRLTEQQNQI